MKLGWIFVFVLGITAFPIASADVQTFSTDLGNVSIDLPYVLTPSNMSSGTILHLVKPETTRPVVSILLQNTWGKDLESFAVYVVGKDSAYTEMTNDDGYRMLFYALDGGHDKEGNPLYEYYAFVDYLTDKDVVVMIMSSSKVVLNGEIIAAFDDDKFKDMSQSFAFAD